jgi:hypothetical protein
MYANILIPTDGSELARKAAFGARSLMAFPKSTIQIALPSHEVHSSIMLRCMSPLLAHSEHSLRCNECPRSGAG